MSKQQKKSSKWDMPKNAIQYLDPGYNAEFIKKHKVLSVLIGIVDVIIVIVPLCGYMMLVNYINNGDIKSTAPLLTNGFEAVLFLLGMIGAIGVVLGIANIWMSVLHQYLGHRFTLITLLGGGTVCAVTLWLIAVI